MGRVQELLTPSPRKGGAQRMFSATTLILEAFVVFFAMLVAHGLDEGTRLLSWTLGGVLAVALLVVAGSLRAWSGYLAGIVLQVGIISMGAFVPMMWWIGLGFAVLYVFGLLKGHQLDREKDEVDRKILAEHGADAG
ncbi:DUF4233 domain-containing protein [Devriesea agamarum]|uniref:DUF4233 domain-containing protein n=1 Tax=Devriesea agamarum TaxID=472569 RepID=UPI00071D11D9|nr:DUF4233 domain-containing protein [Devriesea agamarum]